MRSQEECNRERKNWVYTEDGGSQRKRNKQREEREKTPLEELHFQRAAVIESGAF